MLASIIITNHNYGNYLRRCITSCSNQDFDPFKFEIVIMINLQTVLLKLLENFLKLKISNSL